MNRVEGEARAKPKARRASRASEGWFLGLHVFTNYVKVAFFRGTSLRPVPPGKSTSKDTRYLDTHEDDHLDEAQLAAWVRQASEFARRTHVSGGARGACVA